MLGGNHFKRKLQKKARKKEAKKARREGGKAADTKMSSSASSGARKFTSGSSLIGPVVTYDLPQHASKDDRGFGRGRGRSGASGDCQAPQLSGPARDSANERRNVPFASKREEKMYLRRKHLDSVGPHTKSAAASSAAQRRRVLKHKRDDDLLDHFREKLNASTFRLLNEQIYNSPTAFAATLLKDEGTFREYHTGYQQQLVQWPVNPNQLIIDALLGDKRGRFSGTKGKNMPGYIPPTWTIADMGCGSAQIAVAMKPKGYTVHSFDFCALNEHVTVANTSSVPLASSSVDVCVFALALMATDYELSLFEAFRILKPNRLLKIVEVRSRIPFPKRFAELVEAIGFVCEYEDVAGDYFVAFDFLKVDRQAEPSRELPHQPGDVLMPSQYKKR